MAHDFRVFKTIKARILFSIPIGLLMAFVCGGWAVLDSRFTPLMPNAERYPFFAMFWFACVLMIFCVTWLVDYGMNSK